MPYATADDLRARYDERILADLVSDTGQPVTTLATDAKITAALTDASGRVDAACTVANVYLADDLSGLAGNALSLLKLITCQLAMAALLSRRQERLGDEGLQRVTQEAEDYLDRLRKGERLFGSIEAAKSAGLPTTDGPRTVDYDRMNLLPDRTRNFFPSRGSRLATNRR